MSAARKVLVTADTVCADSLPMSLRHGSPAGALEEAKDIAHFLSHVADAFAAYESGISAEAHKGMALTVDLLIDKLEIGRGSYKFPCFGWGGDVPALVEREVSD